MKRKMIIFSVILVCMISITFIFFNRTEETYTPTIYDINDFVIEKDKRYIILYASEENKYYLGEVLPYALDNDLYDLGNKACHFKMIDNNMIISNNKEVIYSSENNDQILSDVYDVNGLGYLMISYDSKNHDMQILKRESEAKCILTFQYYQDYIPIDLIET